jgi:glycolate oxidase FAD binding subunit
VPPSLSIDGSGPYPVHRPATPAEVGDAVRSAASAGHAVFPLGGGTQLDLGLPPDREGVSLDLTALDQMIDYPAADMTITVQAGITIARLQQTLTAADQRLPIDVPLPDRATLGGTIAANVSGSRRLGAGTLRDYVIGITTVNDEGHETKAGGRVVKNVAGYDLCKLHVGALGTLGVVTQVTLKVRPRPETQAALIFGWQDRARLGGLLDQLHASRTRPICLDVLDARAAGALRGGGLPLPEAPWVVLAGYEDGEAAVNWQIQQLIRELTPAVGGVGAMAGAVVDPLWQRVTDLALWPEARLSLKANLLPAAVAAFCLAAEALPERPLLHAHAGSGVVRAHFAGDLTEDRAAAILNVLTAQAGPDGNVVLTRCPAEWKRRLPVWGRPRNDAWLMRCVKEKLDPKRLFNPGRFVGGL